jgi:hypothetical protein
MAAEARVDVHHCAPRCLLRLFAAAATGLADWSEFEAEAERWGIEVRGLFREDLRALIESSTFKIPATEHLRLHQVYTAMPPQPCGGPRRWRRDDGEQ